MATNNYIQHLHFMSLILTLISVLSITRSMAGITIDLIHRDSPRSPLFSNSTTSHVDKLNAEFQRSILRARYLMRPSDAADTIVVPISGTYIMELGIGTPPTQVFGVLDTGSDLTWTQCEPCVDCFTQTLIPIFDPTKSTSYNAIPCDSAECSTLSKGECNDKKTCAYKYGYADKSSTQGELATETLTFGPEFSFPVPNYVFGCGHNQNQITFNSPGTGIIGLGLGLLSLTTQLKQFDQSGGKFSYCLVPFTGKYDESVSSKITFGDNALLSGDGVVSTPILSGPNPNVYYINLEGVSVGGQTVAFKKQYYPNARLDTNSGDGNTILDSGTTLTFLPAGLLDGLVSELRRQIGVKPVAPPNTIATKLCYSGEFVVPTLTFHFTGANLGLPQKNTFIAVDSDGVIKCLAMMPMDSNYGAIFGNLAQQDFIVGYDIDAKKVSFKATDCTTYV